MTLSHRIKSFMTVFGSVLVGLSLGNFYTLGTLSPYITSYLRLKVDSSFTESYMIWINGFFMLGDGLLMPFAGYLAPVVGTRVVAIIGCVIFSGFSAFSAYCITKSFILFCITYGFVAWIGAGIVSAVITTEGMKWFPARKGLVSSLVLCGFAVGGVALNAIQTGYINPENDPPDQSGIHNGYFTDENLLERVPQVFWITSIITAVLQVLGVALIFTAPKEQPLTESCPSLAVASEVSNAEARELLPNDQDDFTPKQLLRNKEFYLLWVIFACHMMPVSFLTTYYKNYGLTFINDDRFLSTIGAVGTFLTCVSKVSFGALLDKTSYKLCLTVLSAGISIAVQALYAAQFISTETGTKAFYAVFVCLGYSFVGGIFSIIAGVSGEAFGLRHVGANFGLLFSSQAIGSFAGAFIAQAMQDRYLWTWPSFTSVVAFSVAGLFICSFLKKKKAQEINFKVNLVSINPCTN